MYLKNKYFSIYFMLAAFMSPVNYSNIVFPVWNFARSLKFYYKTIFAQSLPLQSLEIRLFCRKLKSRKRRNSSSVFYRNYPKYSNGQRNTGIQGFLAVTATRLQTIKQTLTTSKHSIEFTYSDFPCQTCVDFFADGRVKQAKDWWLPLTFRRAKKTFRNGHPTICKFAF